MQQVLQNLKQTFAWESWNTLSGVLLQHFAQEWFGCEKRAPGLGSMLHRAWAAQEEGVLLEALQRQQIFLWQILR